MTLNKNLCKKLLCKAMFVMITVILHFLRMIQVDNTKLTVPCKEIACKVKMFHTL